METTMRACCQIPIKAEIRNVFRRLWYVLRHAVTVIVSAREAQARRRIRLYYDHRVMDELEKAGKRIAKNKSMTKAIKKNKK